MNRYFIIFIAAAALAACNSATKTEEKEKASYEKAKETLEEKEKKNPANFITASCRDRSNLIGQTVMKISLTSKATVAIYKDIELELSFFSKTGALLQKDVTTIYKTLAPGETVTEKEKQYTPKQTDSISLKVLSAKNASPE
jgi:hypothetical protein